MGKLLDACAAASKAETQARRDRDDKRAAFEAADAKLKTARKYGYKSFDQNVTGAALAEQAYEAAKSAYAAAQEAERAAQMALHEAREPRRAARVEAAKRAISLPMRLMVDVHWNEWDAFSSSHWNLQEIETDASGQWVMKQGKDREGNVVEYPERRFGYSVEVDGPRQDYREQWEGARVSWGSLGARSVADAQTLIEIYQYGVNLAAYLERMRPVWVAEDMAD